MSWGESRNAGSTNRARHDCADLQVSLKISLLRVGQQLASLHSREPAPLLFPNRAGPVAKEKIITIGRHHHSKNWFNEVVATHEFRGKLNPATIHNAHGPAKVLFPVIGLGSVLGGIERPYDFLQPTLAFKPVGQVAVEKTDDMLVLLAEEHHLFTAGCDGFGFKSHFDSLHRFGIEIRRGCHVVRRSRSLGICA